MRLAPGENRVFFNLARRALDLWKENEDLMSHKIFFPKEIMWFLYKPDNPFVLDTLAFYDLHQLRYEIMTTGKAANLYPGIQFSDLDRVLIDHEGGFLKAWESFRLVRDLFLSEGDRYHQDSIFPGSIANNHLDQVVMTDGDLEPAFRLDR